LQIPESITELCDQGPSHAHSMISDHHQHHTQQPEEIKYKERIK